MLSYIYSQLYPIFIADDILYLAHYILYLTNDILYLKPIISNI